MTVMRIVAFLVHPGSCIGYRSDGGVTMFVIARVVANRHGPGQLCAD